MNEWIFFIKIFFCLHTHTFTMRCIYDEFCDRFFFCVMEEVGDINQYIKRKCNVLKAPQYIYVYSCLHFLLFYFFSSQNYNGACSISLNSSFCCCFFFLQYYYIKNLIVLQRNLNFFFFQFIVK